MAINNGIDDGTGYIYHKIREYVGANVVIAASHDMHSNITCQNIADVNAIAGYRTYPHMDQYETGYRAAELGYRLLTGKPMHFACVRIPMIVPAEGYTSENGIFKKLLSDGEALLDSGAILDFSIFQMQPWLNVAHAASSVTVAAEDPVTAKQYAQVLAHKLFAIRKEMGISLYSIDEVIDAAVANETDMPVILVDSADSPNAGSCADSSAVLERLLERNTDLKCAIYVNDTPAAEKAFALGVGAEGDFEIGGTLDPAFQKRIRVHARVHSLHEGIYQNEGPAMRGATANVGKTAVLRIGKIDVVVMRQMCWSYDPQAYRAFGVDPAIYDLVVVKSANQYKSSYCKFSNLFYPTDTPGSSTANLRSLPFDRISHPFYPFDEFEEFDDTPVMAD
jgi:microcystin degradation protein MlrC